MNLWLHQISTLTQSAEELARINSLPIGAIRKNAVMMAENKRLVLDSLRSGPVEMLEVMHRTGLKESAARKHVDALIKKGKVRIVREKKPKLFEAVNSPLH